MGNTTQGTLRIVEVKKEVITDPDNTSLAEGVIYDSVNNKKLVQLLVHWKQGNQ